MPALYTNLYAVSTHAQTSQTQFPSLQDTTTPKITFFNLLYGI